MSVNKVILVGRLGQDPDVRYMPNETAVCNFSLATSSSYKDKSGEKVDQTEWHRIVMFGKVAEIAKEYLKKGSQVFIEGDFRPENGKQKRGRIDTRQRWLQQQCKCLDLKTALPAVVSHQVTLIKQKISHLMNQLKLHHPLLNLLTN